MDIAIWYESDGYRTDGARLMGRQAAGAGFLKAYARHARTDRFTAIVRNGDAGEQFAATVRQFRPEARVGIIEAHRLQEAAGVGIVSYPGPIDPRHAWARNLFGSQAWSLCGVTHTTASAGVMDAVTGWLTAPVQPWDATICTSQAVHRSLTRMLEAQADMLQERLGATRFVLPKLPVIPLGVDCDEQQLTATGRAEARAGLGIGDSDLVVLFVGRLSSHAKANPAPMYIALERLAARHRVVMVECGWTANDAIAASFAEARAKLCPSVRSVVLDGRKAAEVRRAWALADIFCSLSDNIQETFGLAPIEAMAAGIPCVVSDWDGYRDTVRDGEDGFRIPTIAPAPGVAGDFALFHALGLDNYDHYLAKTSQAIAVDVAATSVALERLASDPSLRRLMGEAGARRARAAFDWRVIIAAYEDLWAELNSARTAKPANERASRHSWPSRLDPFDMFAGYPSRQLGGECTIALTPEAETPAFAMRLELVIIARPPVLSLQGMTALRDSLRGPPVKVSAYVKRLPPAERTVAVRALLLLAKVGLIEIRDPLPS